MHSDLLSSVWAKKGLLQIQLQFVNLCVYSHVWGTHTHMCEWIHVLRCAFRGQKQMLGAFLGCCLPNKLMQSLSAKPRAWHVCGYWQSELLLLCLRSKCFAHWASSPALAIEFFKVNLIFSLFFVLKEGLNKIRPWECEDSRLYSIWNWSYNVWPIGFKNSLRVNT